jgi:hypothetical protein
VGKFLNLKAVIEFDDSGEGNKKSFHPLIRDGSTVIPPNFT